jgi:predicted transcriptional regulator YheO
MTLTLANLVATEAEHRGEAIETLRDRTARELRNVIEGFAAAQASTPRGLGRTAKRDLVRQLHRDGYFASKSSTETIADLLGVSRSTVYNYAKQS